MTVEQTLDDLAQSVVEAREWEQRARFAVEHDQNVHGEAMGIIAALLAINANLVQIAMYQAEIAAAANATVPA